MYLFLYESSDLSLEGVDQVRSRRPLLTSFSLIPKPQMYNDPSCKPWTSRKWAPPGYKDRNDLIEQTRAAESGKPLAQESRMEHASTSEKTEAEA